MPVATYASLDKTLNAGHELLPLRMITDVTTSAAHRRRGLLRRLIEDDLADAVGQGRPDRGADRLRGHDLRPLGLRPGDVRAERSTSTPAPVRAPVLHRPRPGRAHRARRRLAAREGRLRHLPRPAARLGRRGRRSTRTSTPAPTTSTTAAPTGKIRAAVHLDADGHVDGFAIFKHDGEDKPTKVDEMVALTAAGAARRSGRSSRRLDRVKKRDLQHRPPRRPAAVGARRPQPA